MTHGNFQIPIPPDVLAEITGWHKVARLDDSKRGVIVPTEAAGEELFFQMLPWGFWRYRLMRGEQVVRGAYCSGPIVAYTEFEPFQLGNKAKFAASEPDKLPEDLAQLQEQLDSMKEQRCVAKQEAEREAEREKHLQEESQFLEEWEEAFHPQFRGDSSESLLEAELEFERSRGDDSP